MIHRIRPRIRDAAVRVAVATAGIVAVVYIVIAMIVTLLVNHNLTSQTDARLRSALTFQQSDRFRPDIGFRIPPVNPRFGAPILVWRVMPDGSVVGNDTTASLPSGARTVTEATTISIGGTDVRILGDGSNGRGVLVGQTMSEVAQTESTLVRAELLVAPVLIGIVFLGALAIGRRVAEPIELARRRQLEFTADASHELRTPLSVIEAHTSLALTKERGVAWYRRAFQSIDVESKRIRRLVEDLLWLARFDSADRTVHPEPVDMGTLAAQAVDRFGTVAETRGLTLGLTVPPEPAIVQAVPEWLDRLLGVLLDNACKYSPDGGRIAVSVAAEGTRVRLTVEDAGPGIPAEQRVRIFDRFHRATDTPGGAGLGLAIADAVVRGSNARWVIGTSPLGGASMTVLIPRSLAGTLAE